MLSIFGILAIVGCCGIPLSLVNLVTKRVHGRPVKNTLITLSVMICFFVVGFLVVSLA